MDPGADAHLVTTRVKVLAGFILRFSFLFICVCTSAYVIQTAITD